MSRENVSDLQSSANAQREIMRLFWGAGFVVGALILIITLWTAASSISGAVVSPGFLRVEAHVQQVQHQEGGIVRRILVKEGWHVTKGQVLLELDDIEVDAINTSMRMQLDTELARLARLEAEKRGNRHISFSAELVARKTDPNVAATLVSEQVHFSERSSMYNQQYRKLTEQREALISGIASLTRQVEAADQSLVFLKEQEKMVVTLNEQKFYPQARVLDAKRASAEKEEKKFEFESLLAQAYEKLADVELRRDSVMTTWHSEAARDIVDSHAKIANLRERLRPAADSLERRQIRSPVSGTINVLKIYNPGSVVTPHDSIVEIVPDQSEIIAEARISPNDINEVNNGQKVEVELSGLNKQTTPLLAGKVTFISPDLNTDPTNPDVKFFVARVDIEGNPPMGVELLPGMPITTYIKTHERTPLELWLDPVIGGMRRSLRER
jgi:HlyD family type I secretion membrane fusion protein